jgi:hypothetical protein
MFHPYGVITASALYRQAERSPIKLQVLAQLSHKPEERRAGERLPAAMNASARRHRGLTEMIRIIDISTQGCGFESRWPMAVGAAVWLALPGLESWAATIVWFRDGRGGLRFARSLHPAVATRYAMQTGGARL